jgi:hypothetical protein
MGRPLQYVPSQYAPVEVTIRTNVGMRLLKSSPEVDEVIVGVLGRALALFDVRLHEFIVFSNHIQYIVSPRNALELARFKCFLHGNIARKVGKLIGWRGKFWGRRGRPIPIVDDAALQRRIRYIYEHGVKEGFVTSPIQWPGPASVKARLSGEPLVGTWFNQTAEHEARRRGKNFAKYDYATKYEIKLSPATCWQHLTEQDYRAKVGEIVSDIEAEANEAARDGKQFAGVEWLEAQDRFEIPKKLQRSAAPLCHASTKASYKSYKAKYLAFVSAFYEAATALRDGVLDAVFPPGSFPPPRPFVQVVESFAPT